MENGTVERDGEADSRLSDAMRAWEGAAGASRSLAFEECVAAIEGLHPFKRSGPTGRGAVLAMLSATEKEAVAFAVGHPEMANEFAHEMWRDLGVERCMAIERAAPGFVSGPGELMAFNPPGELREAGLLSFGELAGRMRSEGFLGGMDLARLCEQAGCRSERMEGRASVFWKGALAEDPDWNEEVWAAYWRQPVPLGDLPSGVEGRVAAPAWVALPECADPFAAFEKGAAAPDETLLGLLAAELGERGGPAACEAFGRGVARLDLSGVDWGRADWAKSSGYLSREKSQSHGALPVLAGGEVRGWFKAKNEAGAILRAVVGSYEISSMGRCRERALWAVARGLALGEFEPPRFELVRGVAGKGGWLSRAADGRSDFFEWAGSEPFEASAALWMFCEGFTLPCPRALAWVEAGVDGREVAWMGRAASFLAVQPSAAEEVGSGWAVAWAESLMLRQQARGPDPTAKPAMRI